MSRERSGPCAILAILRSSVVLMEKEVDRLGTWAVSTMARSAKGRGLQVINGALERTENSLARCVIEWIQEYDPLLHHFHAHNAEHEDSKAWRFYCKRNVTTSHLDSFSIKECWPISDGNRLRI